MTPNDAMAPEDTNADEEIEIVEGGITDVNGLVPLGGSSDVGGTGNPESTADIGASTGAAGLVPAESTSTETSEEMDDIRDSDLLGGDIIHAQSDDN